jgi:hypothetical protein
MEARGQRNLGLLMAAAGLAVLVLAVLLFGLTTTTGALDWVSIITAVGGLALAGVGLYLAFYKKGTGPVPTGPYPHTASWDAPERRYPESSLRVKSRRRP